MASAQQRNKPNGGCCAAVSVTKNDFKQAQGRKSESCWASSNGYRTVATRAVPAKVQVDAIDCVMLGFAFLGRS